jgi:hypothetical protein
MHKTHEKLMTPAPATPANVYIPITMTLTIPIALRSEAAAAMRMTSTRKANIKIGEIQKEIMEIIIIAAAV